MRRGLCLSNFGKTSFNRACHVEEIRFSACRNAFRILLPQNVSLLRLFFEFSARKRMKCEFILFLLVTLDDVDFFVADSECHIEFSVWFLVV